jgi:DNA (cytosine-5)-methyltransferase 1
LLGAAFEQEGCCVVRGPDLLLGGDILRWHALPGRFDGVIGGPPCKSYSRACRGNQPTQGNLIPEFERIVAEAGPAWWLCENVPAAPVPKGAVYSEVLDAWVFGAAQHRRRRFSSNLPLKPIPVPMEERHPDPWPCVTATEHKHSAGSRNRRRAGRKVGRRMTLTEVNVAMGLPAGFETPCLKVEAAYGVRGNGVALPMGLALARAVKEALRNPTAQP